MIKRSRIVSAAQRMIDRIPYRERPKGPETRLERQELWCHGCDNYVQFDCDVALNGNHVLECPRCGHEHCRVVRDGRITDIRWGQRNGPTWVMSVSNATVSGTSTFTVTNSTSGTRDVFLYSAWMDSGTSS